MDKTEIYVACQDRKILGVYTSEAAAYNECLAERERDKFCLIFKRGLLKRILKNHQPLQTHSGRYYVARVTEILKEEEDEQTDIRLFKYREKVLSLPHRFQPTVL